MGVFEDSSFREIQVSKFGLWAIIYHVLHGQGTDQAQAPTLYCASVLEFFTFDLNWQKHGVDGGLSNRNERCMA